jgi:hypothetical protein
MVTGGILLAYKESFQLEKLHHDLIKAAQDWTVSSRFRPEQTGETRCKALLLNHARYLSGIPAYQKMAVEEGCGEEVDIQTIKSKLMFTDEIFKSYRQEWLDRGSFGEMNRWLSSLFYRPVEMDLQDINSIDDWIAGLAEAGIMVSYSSGTSGTFSFVPRDIQDWEKARTANISYLTPLLTSRKVEPGLSRWLSGSAVKLLSPENLVKSIKRTGLPGFDGFFLGFRQGRMGNQVLMQELASIFRRSYFLYNIDLTASALRCLQRGPQSENQQKLLDELLAEVNGRKKENYVRLIDRIEASHRERQRIFIFGAPYQFKEMCDIMSGLDRKLTLHPQSLILFGGGWKTFSGDTQNRDSLVMKLEQSFGLPAARILEGYSMTEINVLMLRCDAGRFHIPPLIEPVVLDEALTPLEGPELEGTFGFLDPLAVSYPGFIITGDRVRLLEGECPCGLSGPALTEIGRARSREVKGCGGIMGSITA